MEHVVSGGNWHMKLADAIEKAEDGDTIVVPSESAISLGESAKRRMCPEKKITFVVRDTSDELFA